MLRLFLFGFISILLLITSILSILLVFNLIKWTKKLFASGKNFTHQQHQNWKTKQSEKNIPSYLREAKKRMDHIDRLNKQLTGKWQLLTSPLIKQSDDMLQLGITKPQQAEISRSFYTITLKATESFIEALVHMNEVMQDLEEEKARDNIEVLLKDTYKYRAKLESKKRFDFHVMMEVMKQRFGK